MATGKALKSGSKAPDFTIEDALGKEFKLSEFLGKKNVVLVFLRYMGCPICQLSLQQLKDAYGDFAGRDTEVAVFVQSPVNTIEKNGGAGMFPFRLIPDPDETIYNLYGVGSGNLLSLMAPQTVSKALKATFKGHMQGKMEGNSWQLPGDFIVAKDGLLKLARVGKNMGDNLSPEELLSHL